MRTIVHNEDTKQINYLDNRYYTNDGKTFFPSVTTILDVYPKGFGFNQWLKDVGSNAEQIAERAASTGSAVHDACDRLNKGMELKWATEQGRGIYSIEEWQMILRYAEFWKTTDAELVCSETNFCSPELGFGGTLDIVAMINGKRWLLDIKTSNYIHTSHELQLSAYAKLWDEHNPPIDHVGIIWLKASTRTDKTDHAKSIYQGAGWQVKSFDRTHHEAFKIFQHTQAIWKEENANYKPLNMIYPDRLKLEVTVTA